jgi:hypothetical protein
MSLALHLGRALALVFLLWSTNLGFAKVQSQGEVILSSRAFLPDDVDGTEDFGLAASFRLDTKARQKGGFRQQLRVFGRAAMIDEERSVLMVEDAWAGWRNNRFEIKAGVQTLNWSAAEAFHPTDMINARNLDSNVENAEKIGEPMVTMRLRFLNGGLTGYYMPLRMAPRFPSASSRLTPYSGVHLAKAQWSDSNGLVDADDFSNQYAFRLDQTIGQGDLALHYVAHNDRLLPAIALDATTLSPTPVFPFVQRFGGSLVQALGDWLIKVEVDHILVEAMNVGDSLNLVQGPPGDHTVVAAGLEYGWSYDSGAEGSLIVESQVLILPGGSEQERNQMGPFQRDALLGYRHSLNDEMGTEIMLGMILDVERPGEYLGSFSYRTRLSDVWQVHAQLRTIRATDELSFLYGQDGSHSAYLDFIRAF